MVAIEIARVIKSSDFLPDELDLLGRSGLQPTDCEGHMDDLDLSRRNNTHWRARSAIPWT